MVDSTQGSNAGPELLAAASDSDPTNVGLVRCCAAPPLLGVGGATDNDHLTQAGRSALPAEYLPKPVLSVVERTDDEHTG
jgi:hypothetical protein